METLLINIPEKKSTLVKQLLKELGVTIQNQTKARQLANEVNRNVKSGQKPDLDEIVSEVNSFRAEQ